MLSERNLSGALSGWLITGAQPLEAFARVIDDELARVVAAQSGAR
jgi:hypothetical protein